MSLVLVSGANTVSLSFNAAAATTNAGVPTPATTTDSLPTLASTTHAQPSALSNASSSLCPMSTTSMDLWLSCVSSVRWDEEGLEVIWKGRGVNKLWLLLLLL